MPMNNAQLETVETKNMQVVSGTPHVKSSKTCDLFNAGVIPKSKTAKVVDPTCYNAVTVKEMTGLFDIVENDMTDTKAVPLWKKGDVVNIFQISMSKGLMLEGRATVSKVIGGWDEHYMVRFHGKDGKPQREAYERFIDRDGQVDAGAYIAEFNKKIGYAS